MLAPALLAVALSFVAGAAPSQPVAVAPWKNLNDDASLAWLEQGAAETMAADLKRAGLDVVERTQIAEALAQVAAAQHDDVARAVAAGRIVGARSIVLGAFQKSGAQLRLTGRIVDVETGRVQGAATATGKLDDVFSLQDEILAGLAGRTPAANASAKKMTKPRKDAARAYERFSMSLTTAAPAEQRALLEESLRLDPDLVYARDALAALEARLRTGAAQTGSAFDARTRDLLAIVDDTRAAIDRRHSAARALLTELEASRRFRSLRSVAERVLAAKLPRDAVQIDDVDEAASYARVLAHARLREGDLALQAGERHLSLFATGAHRAAVEQLVRAVIEERRTRDERTREYRDELAEIGVDLRSAAGSEDAAWKRCIAAKWSKLPAEMVQNCTAFLAAFPRSEHAAAGRAFVAWGHALSGEFAQARAAADALERDLPGSVEDTGLRTVMSTWSAD